MPKRHRHIEVYGAIGTRVKIDGQEYELIDIRPSRPGGEPRAFWQTHCWDCSKPMIAHQPVGSLELSRRCPDHARKGVRVR